MASNVWALPGPAQFLDRVRNELTSGRNVVVLLPRHAPDGLRAALKSIMTDAWAWADVDADDCDSPTLALCERYGVECAPTFKSAIHNLAMHEAFAGQILWLNTNTEASWKVWKPFLAEYASASRAVPEGRRSLFVTLIEGLAVGAAPSEDITLCNIAWCDVIGEIDLLIYATLSLQNAGYTAAKRNLLALTVTRVAMWDLELADRLLDERPQEMLAPLPVLNELARDRQWNEQTPIAWELGTQCSWDGARQTHSAICAARGDERTVEHRIWSSQASIILPLIEKRRLEILDGVRRFIKLPIQIDEDLICDVQDLEIGPLAQMVSKSSAAPRIKQRLQRLKRVRNQLAHMEILDLAQAWHDDIYDVAQ